MTLGFLAAIWQKSISMEKSMEKTNRIRSKFLNQFNSQTPFDDNLFLWINEKTRQLLTLI